MSANKQQDSRVRGIALHGHQQEVVEFEEDILRDSIPQPGEELACKIVYSLLCFIRISAIHWQVSIGISREIK